MAIFHPSSPPDAVFVRVASFTAFYQLCHRRDKRVILIDICADRKPTELEYADDVMHVSMLDHRGLRGTGGITVSVTCRFTIK